MRPIDKTAVHPLSVISIHALVKRATGNLVAVSAVEKISIHALVKRATNNIRSKGLRPDISIHALVKRATIRKYDEAQADAEFQSTPS